MAKTVAVAQRLTIWNSALAWNTGLVLAASLFVALCARAALPLPFTPVPLSLVNFAVLLVGLLLGPWRAAAAMGLYLAQGAIGLPVFAPGPGGLAQLLGPTGGFLFAFPAVAFVAGSLSRVRLPKFAAGAFTLNLLAAGLANLLLFAGGVVWLMVVFKLSPAQALAFGLYPFLFAEVMKVMLAAGAAARWNRAVTR